MALVAEALFEKSDTPHLVLDRAIRQAVGKSGVSRKPAKDWVNLPDSQCQLKKTAREIYPIKRAAVLSVCRVFFKPVFKE